MSYQRSNYPLKYFKIGKSIYYVFAHVENYIEDYDVSYIDVANRYGLDGLLSFIELIGTITLRKTRDEKYAAKIVHALAWKFHVSHLLREEYR